MQRESTAFRWASRGANTLAKSTNVSNYEFRLGGGLAFPGELPDIISEAVVAATAREEGLQYGPLYGLDDLRDAIVRYLASDGINTARENILIVNGAKQGLDLACRVFMEKGDFVIVTAPSYITAVSILKTHEASFMTVAIDMNGMCVDDLENQLIERKKLGQKMPKLLFDVPDFHNPTGFTLSEERRRRLVALAVEYDFLIIEDDPYRRVRFEGRSVPPIKSFDEEGRVIGLGTVSKILSPGLRVGWVNAHPQIVRRMAAQKSDGGNNPLVQRIVAQLMSNGRVDEHVASIQKALRLHRDAMVEAVRRYMPGAKFETPKGGYFLWVELPSHIDSDVFVSRAAALGVEIFSGKPFYAANVRNNYVRFAFSFCSPSEISHGIARLGEVYGELLGIKDSFAAAATVQTTVEPDTN